MSAKCYIHYSELDINPSHPDHVYLLYLETADFNIFFLDNPRGDELLF